MQTQAKQGFLDRFFKLSEKNTTVKTELLAGLTTFIALAYIIFVNPNILSEAGIPKEAAIASTIWIAALSTMVMGVFANYPVALAPGMGLNAFFAYYVCGTLGLHWTVALGAVFFSGVLFLILTISHIRQAIINAVPQNLRVAIGVGIGLFIAFVGLKGTGLIIPDKATFIGLGHVTNPTTLLSLFGLVLTGALMARNIQGSILIGIVARRGSRWCSAIRRFRTPSATSSARACRTWARRSASSTSPAPGTTALSPSSSPSRSSSSSITWAP